MSASIITVLMTLLLDEPVYVSGFTPSPATNNYTGKILIPHFTSDLKKAHDFGSEESAKDIALVIIDYQGRYYRAETIDLNAF